MLLCLCVIQPQQVRSHDEDIFMKRSEWKHTSDPVAPTVYFFSTLKQIFTWAGLKQLAPIEW